MINKSNKVKVKVKRFAPKLNIKTGDTVLVIAGRSKGTVGKVLSVKPIENRAIVENVDMVTKHIKPTNNNPGGITTLPAPIHISNIALVDPQTGERTRVGRKEVDGKLVRYSKKTGEIIG
jgi:large subunit ribosomal protein L24